MLILFFITYRRGLRASKSFSANPPNLRVTVPFQCIIWKSHPLSFRRAVLHNFVHLLKIRQTFQVCPTRRNVCMYRVCLRRLILHRRFTVALQACHTPVHMSVSTYSKSVSVCLSCLTDRSFTAGILKTSGKPRHHDSPL